MYGDICEFSTRMQNSAYWHSLDVDDGIVLYDETVFLMGSCSYLDPFPLAGLHWQGQFVSMFVMMTFDSIMNNKDMLFSS